MYPVHLAIALNGSLEDACGTVFVQYSQFNVQCTEKDFRAWIYSLGKAVVQLVRDDWTSVRGCLLTSSASCDHSMETASSECKTQRSRY